MLMTLAVAGLIAAIVVTALAIVLGQAYRRHLIESRQWQEKVYLEREKLRQKGYTPLNFVGPRTGYQRGRGIL